MELRILPLFSAIVFASLSLQSNPSNASEGIRPELFSGTYVPRESPIDTDLVKGVREITIRVDKSTNTLYALITRAKNEDDEGRPFIPALTQINLEPIVIQSKTHAGCTVFEQSSQAQPTRLVSTIDETFKAGCWIRTRYQHTEITLQFTHSSEEIWIGIGPTAEAPSKKYFLRRLPSASEVAHD